MLHAIPSRCAGRKRPGKALALFVMLAPVLIGMTGLVVDAGLLMAAQRQAQNAADAAALAAAYQKLRGASDSAALTDANTFLTNNGLTGVTLSLNAGASNALNIPPQDPTNTGSTYKGVTDYVEVFVTKPVTTLFIQVLGVNRSQQVTARAIAGYEPVGAGEGVFVLDPTASPGLDVGSNQGSNAFVRLRVNGDITVNSYGGGQDQYGNTVSPNSTYVSGNSDGVKTQSGLSVPSIVATQINIAGGISDRNSVASYDTSFSPNYYDTSSFGNGKDTPVLANLQTTAPDPLASLTAPSTSGTSQGNVTIGNGQTVTLSAGVYQSIAISGGTVTMNPGIYVVGSGFNGNGNSFSINGGTVTANGVMIYNMAGKFSISGSPNVTLTSYSSTDSYNGLMYYQDRSNTLAASISGSTSAASMSGTFYAPKANLALSGSGSFNAQFIVGSMSITGGSTVTIDATGKTLGRANLVFLVE